MKIGCAWVSSLEQNPELRIDALEKAGYGEIFQDKGQEYFSQMRKPSKPHF